MYVFTFTYNRATWFICNVIPMNDLTYYILTGIIAGIGISITVEISPKHHK